MAPESDKVFISDLQENEFVQTPFLVADKSIRTTKNGDPYLCVTLRDRTGDIEGRGWDRAEMLANRFDVDDFVMIRGQVSSWNDELQLTLEDVKKLEDEAVDFADFLPCSRWSSEAMFEQLLDEIRGGVRSDDVRRILEAIFEDDAVVDAFKTAPAATSNHHAYRGGLLEHCLSMTRMARRICRHYAHYYPGDVNQDLVIAGCVLHDIGKIEELQFQRSFRYSTEGQLVGHITQGVEMLTEAARRLDPRPPRDLLDQIKHLILSHHGKREYGSPVKPRTPEAMLLHQIDMIDSRMNMWLGHLEEHRDGVEADEEWTGYHRTLERSIFAGTPESAEWSKPDAPASEPDGPGAVPDDHDPSGGSEENDSNLSLFE
jgi:3'-5' exoribonuclease